MNDIYQKQIEENIDALFNTLEKQVSQEDIARIKSAYALAAEAHKEQRRKSGEPYIIHPIAVARIVAEELELGANPVIAAFLHDVVEDSDYTIDDIRKLFGDDVAFLVGVVTKQKGSKYEHSKQIDNFRQMLASVQYDIRALLIKLSDRLHNMRTLASMRADKQMKIAGETDYFYAPLANRLGLYHIKRELENLSFQYRCPKEYAMLSEQVATYRKDHSADIEGLAERIRVALRERYDLDVRTEIRYRTPYSIWRKIQATGCDFNHVDIKHYIRIIYNTDNQNATSRNDIQRKEKNLSLQIYAALTDMFKERPGSVTNYIDTPKENGYQSFHVMILSDHGSWEEVHISSERMVRNARLGCSAEQAEAVGSSWIDKFRSVLHDIAYHGHEIEFMEGVTSSFYNEDIMVFTPKGHGIILPVGATAIDFAFEIHSDIGRHAEYARINGTLQSIKTVLKRGDCVEIGTNENVEPSADWLDSICTYKAKRQLRTIFATKKQLGYIRCTHCHPLPGDEVVGFNSNDATTIIHKRTCPLAIRQASQHGEMIVSVNFEENAEFVYPVRIHIRGVDRYHLLSDLIECITEQQRLSMTKLQIDTVDRIVSCAVDFMIHSSAELQATINTILTIRGVDEVQRIDIE